MPVIHASCGGESSAMRPSPRSGKTILAGHRVHVNARRSGSGKLG